VILDEAVELARRFGDGSPAFVNGVLDAGAACAAPSHSTLRRPRTAPGASRSCERRARDRVETGLIERARRSRDRLLRQQRPAARGAAGRADWRLRGRLSA
jgi:hypothetical protein